MEDGSENRLDPRVPLILRVDYRGEASLVRDCTENLSAGGLFLRTDRVLEPGDKLPLVLSFPGLLDPVEIEVQVVRCRAARAGEPAGVAVKIPDHRAGDREKLARLAAAAISSKPLPARSSYRVLLVEDNPHILEMYAHAVRRLASANSLGALIDFAANGMEAWCRLLQPPAPDLVITDLYMPMLDGFSLLERIRLDQRTRTLPVIVISAGSDDARERANELGVDVYFQKPVRLMDVVTTVEALLKIQPAHKNT